MNFHEACTKVISASETAKPGANIRYAASYAQAGLRMRDEASQRVQALYILNNLSGWRGEEAREVKAALKAIAG